MSRCSADEVKLIDESSRRGGESQSYVAPAAAAIDSSPNPASSAAEITLTFRPGDIRNRADLVFQILEQANRPLCVSDIVEVLNGIGAPVGGKVPTNTLAVTLHRDSRFYAFPARGRSSRWYLTAWPV